MAARERPSKRARAELKDGSSPPAASNALETIGLSLERLPGDLLSRIVQLLSLKEAFRLRGVSRAIRDAVEETAFDGAKLDLDAMQTEELKGLERLVRDGRLKGGELSVSVMCKCLWTLPSLGEKVEQPLRLLAALAGRCRSVRVEFAEPHAEEQVFNRHIVRERVEVVLDALAPGGAASPLQELQLHCNSKQAFYSYDPLDVLTIFEEYLAPLAGLRSLLLPDLPLSVGTSAAIAAHLPALRCLQCFYGKDQRGALMRLGPLCLERLVLHPDPRPGDNPGLRLDELSDTPLGRSLRELHIEETAPTAFFVHGYTSSSFSADDLDALAGMPQLEAVTGYVGLTKDLGGAVSRGLQSLLRAPRLSVLQLSFFGVDSSTAFSAALVAALAAGPLPSRLALDLRVSWYSISQIVNAGAGPILRGVDVDVTSATDDAAAAVSAALLRCPRLESLVIRADVRSTIDVADLAAGLAPLAALPPLPGGLRFEVTACGRRSDGLEELAARAKESLSAALPAAAFHALFRLQG
eukprot:tig00001007_g6241.t2